MTYLAADPMETTIHAVMPDWNGALPGTFLFDASGTLVDKIQGEGSLQDFEAKIQPLLAK